MSIVFKCFCSHNEVSWIENNPIDFHRTEEKKIQFEQNFNFWVLFELSLGFKTSCRWLKHANVWSIVQIYMLICMNLSFSYLLMENVSSCMCQRLCHQSEWEEERECAIEQFHSWCSTVTTLHYKQNLFLTFITDYVRQKHAVSDHMTNCICKLKILLTSALML